MGDGKEALSLEIDQKTWTMKKEKGKTLSSLWYNIKRYTWNPRTRREKNGGKYLKKKSHNFLSMTRDINLDLRSWVHSKQTRCINPNKATSHPRYLMVKVLKTKEKEKNLKTEIKDILYSGKQWDCPVFSLEQRPDTVKWFRQGAGGSGRETKS